MEPIDARHGQHAHARFELDEGYPSLAPTEGNRRLLAMASEASVDLGFGPIEAVDPMRAGAADVSFVGDIAPMVLDAMGLKGDGGHTSQEWADLGSLRVQAKRTAILLARLARR
jgi:glutamate carboxypeptidase